MVKKFLSFAFLWFVATSGFAKENGEDALIKQGEALFQSKGCVACHTLTDQRLVGPGLRGVFDRLEKAGKDETWLATYLKNPPAMVEKDPYLQKLHQIYQVVMPNLGLKENEIQALIAYLKVATQPPKASPSETQATQKE